MIQEAQMQMMQKVMIPSVKQYDFFNEYMVRRRQRLIRNNKNWLAIAVGGTGDGKSWTAARECEYIDPNFINNIKEFGIKSVVAFGKAQDYLKMIDSGIEDHILKRGSMCMFDEAGVGVPSREWYKEQNKDFSYVSQTFRNLNIGTIFTTPDISFIDSQPRKLFHDYQKAIKVIIEKKVVVIQPLVMENNPRMGKIYYKYPFFHGIQIRRLYVGKPSQIFINEYEPAKDVFNNTLRKESIKAGDKAEHEKEKRRQSDDDRLERLAAVGIPVSDTPSASAFLGCDRQIIYRLQRRQKLKNEGILK